MLQVPQNLEKKLQLLFERVKDKVCIVAFSGGVDSSTLAKALEIAHENGVIPVPPTGYFAESASSTELEKSEARRVAAEIGLKLRTVESNEFDDPTFVENNPKRCYWCKKIRFSALKELAQHEVGDPLGKQISLFDGTNADDSGDYRPGVTAAQEVGVESPLAEAGLTKAEIRQLASIWGLSVAEKPSTPCLATRIAYFVPIKEEILRQIEQAELLVRSLGFASCRARVDAPGSVRIEVLESEIENFVKPENRSRVVEELLKIGFNFVSLDLEGFRSGKNNRAVLREG